MPRIQIANLGNVEALQGHEWPFGTKISAPTPGTNIPSLDIFVEKNGAEDLGRIIVAIPQLQQSAEFELNANPTQLEAVLANITWRSHSLIQEILTPLNQGNGRFDIAIRNGEVYVGKYDQNPAQNTAPLKQFNNLFKLKFDHTSSSVSVEPLDQSEKKTISELRHHHDVATGNYNGTNLNKIGKKLFDDLGQITDPDTVNLVRKTLSAAVCRADGTSGNNIHDRLKALTELIDYLTTDETQSRPAKPQGTKETLLSLVPTAGTQSITPTNFQQLSDFLAISQNPTSLQLVRLFPQELEGVQGKTREDMARIIKPAILKGVMNRHVIKPGIRDPLDRLFGADGKKLKSDSISDAVNHENTTATIAQRIEEKTQALIEVTTELKTNLDALNSSPTGAQLLTIIKNLNNNVIKHPQIAVLNAAAKNEFKRIAKLAQAKARIELAKKIDETTFSSGSNARKAIDEKVKAAEEKLKSVFENYSSAALETIQNKLLEITRDLSPIIKINTLHQNIASLKQNPITKKQGERLEKTLNTKQKDETGGQSSPTERFQKALETGDTQNIDSVIDNVVKDADAYVQLSETKTTLESWKNLVNNRIQSHIEKTNFSFTQASTQEMLAFNAEANALLKRIDQELKSDMPEIDGIKEEFNILKDRTPDPTLRVGNPARATLATQLETLRNRLATEASVVGTLSQHPELFKPQGLQADVGAKNTGDDHKSPTSVAAGTTTNVKALSGLLDTQTPLAGGNPNPAAGLRGTAPVGPTTNGSQTSLRERYAYAEQRLAQLSSEIRTLGPNADVTAITAEITALTTFLDNAKAARDAADSVFHNGNTVLENTFTYHLQQTTDPTAAAPANPRLAAIHTAVNQLDATALRFVVAAAQAARTPVPAAAGNVYAAFYQQTRASIQGLADRIAAVKASYANAGPGTTVKNTAEKELNRLTKEAATVTQTLRTATVIAELNEKLTTSLQRTPGLVSDSIFLGDDIASKYGNAYREKQQQLFDALDLLRQPNADVGAIARSVSMLECEIMLIPGIHTGERALAQNEKRLEQFRLIQLFAKALGLTPASLGNVLSPQDVQALTTNQGAAYRPSDATANGINHRAGSIINNSYEHGSNAQLTSIAQKLKNIYQAKIEAQDETSRELLQQAQTLQVRLQYIRNNELSVTEKQQLDATLVDAQEFVQLLQKVKVDLQQQIASLKQNGGIGSPKQIDARIKTLKQKQTECNTAINALNGHIQHIEANKTAIKAQAKAYWRIDNPNAGQGVAVIQNEVRRYAEFNPDQGLEEGSLGGLRQQLSWRRSEQAPNRYAYVITKKGTGVVVHHEKTYPDPHTHSGSRGFARFKHGPSETKTIQEFAGDVALAVNDLTHMRRDDQDIEQQLYTIRGGNTRDLLIAYRAAQDAGIKNVRVAHTKACFNYDSKGNPCIASWDQTSLEKQLRIELKAAGKTQTQISATFADIDKACKANAKHTQQNLPSINSSLFTRTSIAANTVPPAPLVAP